jgi:hypothetical protein
MQSLAPSGLCNFIASPEIQKHCPRIAISSIVVTTIYIPHILLYTTLLTVSRKLRKTRKPVAWQIQKWRVHQFRPSLAIPYNNSLLSKSV